MSLSRVCVVVCVLVLAGCAIGPRHQAIDAAAAARLRGVVIAQPPDQARYSSAISDPGPMVTGGPPALAVLQLGVLLALVADAQHKGAQLTAAVEPLQPRLQERLAELLREGLAAQGFEPRIVVAPALGGGGGTATWLRGQAIDDALGWLRGQGPADAALVFLLDAGVSKDPSTQVWCPTLAATVRGVDLASGSALYEDSFGVGCAKPALDLRRIDSAAEHRFESFDALLADPARVRDGWYAGLGLIADAILHDIERRAAP